MLIADFRLLIDENIPPLAAAHLKSVFEDAVYVAETDLRGKPDEALIEYALQNNRIIITQDKSFGHNYPKL